MQKVRAECPADVPEDVHRDGSRGQQAHVLREHARRISRQAWGTVLKEQESVHRASRREQEFARKELREHVHRASREEVYVLRVHPRYVPRERRCIPREQRLCRQERFPHGIRRRQ